MNDALLFYMHSCYPRLAFLFILPKKVSPTRRKLFMGPLGPMMFTGRHKPTIKGLPSPSYVILFTARMVHPYDANSITQEEHLPTEIRGEKSISTSEYFYTPNLFPPSEKNDLQTFIQTFASNNILCKVTHRKFASVI